MYYSYYMLPDGTYCLAPPPPGVDVATYYSTLPAGVAVSSTSGVAATAPPPPGTTPPPPPTTAETSSGVTTTTTITTRCAPRPQAAGSQGVRSPSRSRGCRVAGVLEAAGKWASAQPEHSEDRPRGPPHRQPSPGLARMAPPVGSLGQIQWEGGREAAGSLPLTEVTLEALGGGEGGTRWQGRDHHGACVVAPHCGPRSTPVSGTEWEALGSTGWRGPSGHLTKHSGVPRR